MTLMGFTRDPFADLLLGLPGTVSRFTPRSKVADRMYDIGAFAQDDFKLTQNLTIQYGLRINSYTAPTDKNGFFYQTLG